MLRPRTLLLAMMAATLLLAPLAQAQGQSTLVVQLEPTRDALAPGDLVLLQGTATYTADALAHSSLVGIPIQYIVKDAPAWAAVMVTPASDILHLPSPSGPTVTATSNFAVIVGVPANMTGAAIGPITITAVTGAPNGLVHPAAASGSTPVRLVEGPGCDDGGAMVTQAAGATVFAPGLGLLALAPLGLVALGRGRSAGARLGLAMVALGAVGALAATPTAAAQGSSSVLVWIDSSAAPLEPDGRIVLRGEAMYVADATMHTMTSGVPVEFHVRDAPAWATVSVTPASGVFTPPAMPGFVHWSTIPFDVIVDAAPDAPEGALAVLTIGAVTGGNSLVHPAAGHGSALVATALPPCARPEADPAFAAPVEMPLQAAAEGDGTNASEDVSVQTSTATPRAVMPVVIGCALVGGALGLALARRRSS